MALFIQKPIFWNTNQYQMPSGVIAKSGFPQQTGYGHEEWNNSPRMVLTRRGNRFRVFHTEGLGEAPLAENAGQTFVFMTASHNGIQQLVGIAGNAVGLFDEVYLPQRQKMARDLALDEHSKEAWDVPNVRRQYGDDQRKFLKDWKKDLPWTPNWLCPDEFFWWLDEPVTLDARAITGKAKLLTMFGSYTQWELPTVARVLDAIPQAQRQEKYLRLSDALQCAPADPLPLDEQDDQSEPVTDVLTQTNARRGQGKFREDLLRIWGGACAVTELDCRELLIASHIQPWKKSKTTEKIDAQNGLLLSANLDKLFDSGLISFEDDGRMLLSPWLSKKHREVLGLPRRLRFAPEGLARYLKFHREHRLQK